MAKAKTFDEAGARRIVKSVRWTEGARADTSGQRRRFVTSYAGGVIRAVVASPTSFAPNRWRYVGHSLETWNEAEKKWDSADDSAYAVLYNDWEEKNTDTLLRGTLSVIGLEVLPAPELVMQVYPTGATEGDSLVYTFAFPNDVRCAR